MIDSQAVKNTCNAGIESKGFCFYKTTNGIKRHLAVDILGFPFFTHCTKANVSDDQGLIEMLTQNIDYFKSKPLERPKITILVDHGYQERENHPSVRANLSSNHDQDPVLTVPKAIYCRKGSLHVNPDLFRWQPDGSSKGQTLG